MSNKSKIEICANSVESAVKAQQAGAYRVDNTGGALSFRRASSGQAGVVIGNHVFF